MGTTRLPVPISVIARGRAIQVRKISAAPPHALPSCRCLRTAQFWTVSGFCSRQESGRRQLLHVGDVGASLPGRDLHAAQVGALRISCKQPRTVSSCQQRTAGDHCSGAPSACNRAAIAACASEGNSTLSCTERAVLGSGVYVGNVMPSLTSRTHSLVAVDASSGESAKYVQMG